jgi:hypothetical protein
MAMVRVGKKTLLNYALRLYVQSIVPSCVPAFEKCIIQFRGINTAEESSINSQFSMRKQESPKWGG